MPRYRAALVVVVSAVTLAACGGGTGGADLQRILSTLAREQHSGAIALVDTKAGTWRGAAGNAQGTRRADPSNRFGIASTTKAFVAAVTMQLVGEGRLSLSDTVEHHLPGRLRDGRRITVRQLLNHSSGLPPDVSGGVPPRAQQQPLLFPPGSAHSYSNLNFVVLGLIVEKVTGRRLDRALRDRILEPLRLDHTSFGTVLPRARGAWLGVALVPSDSVDGASGIVSTLDDLARFFRALLAGELLRPNLVSEMTETIAASGNVRAGLGLFRIETACGPGWGYGGDEASYSNQVLASRDATKIVVVAQNTLGWQGAKAAAEKLFCE